MDEVIRRWHGLSPQPSWVEMGAGVDSWVEDVDDELDLWGFVAIVIVAASNVSKHKRRTS